MTALAQGCGGLALVMSFALLRTRQIRSAAGLLAVQAVVSAISAIALHQPLMALPPLLLAACVWLAPGRIAMLEPGTAPIGGAKIGILAASVLAALCQSQGAIGLPLAVILLSALLAVTRRHSLMHVVALMAMQNGLGHADDLKGRWCFAHRSPILRRLLRVGVNQQHPAALFGQGGGQIERDRGLSGAADRGGFQEGIRGGAKGCGVCGSQGP